MKALPEEEYEKIVKGVLEITNYHANNLLSDMNKVKTNTPELYFESMIIYMIDGLNQLGVSDEIIKDHISNHLKGHTYFYSKENNIANKSLH